MKRIVHKAIIPPTVGQRAQSDLIDLRMHEGNGYKYILNYPDCFSKFIVLSALKTKSAVEECEHLISIFCEHGAPHIFQTANGGEFTNQMLNTALLTEWKSTRFVHGRPRKSTYQGSIERANSDVERLLFPRFRSLKKPMDQWVSELKYVQYTKNNVKHSALGRTPFEIHFGKTPPDLSVFEATSGVDRLAQH